MKEYLDSTLRQTLLLMYALTLALDDIISVSRNSSKDYLNAYSAAFPASFMYWSAQLKCILSTSDSISQPSSSPYIDIIDLSLVRVVTVNQCFRMPLGYVMKEKSSPARQLPLDLTVWVGSTVLQKVYSAIPNSLSPTCLKEEPKKRKRQESTPRMMRLAIRIFHLSFI